MINEQFEGPGAAGWTSTTGGALIAWSDTYTEAPAPLTGSYSAKVESTGQYRVNALKTFSPTGNVYCRFLINHQKTTVGQGVLATIRDSAGNILSTFGLLSSVTIGNAARMQVGGAAGVTAASLGPTTGSSAINYYGWFEYEKGTPGLNNAIARGGYTLTGSSARPTWPLSGASGLLAVSTGGTVTGNASRIMFGRTEAVINYNVIIDDIQVQSTPFA